MLKIKLSILICVICMLDSIKAKESNTCNRSCGSQPIKDLPAPFGFSSGCQIPLNCTGNGGIFIDEFQVQSFFSDHILVNIPGSCSRPIDYIRRLYGLNYAPTSNNGILLQNCSSPVTSCLIPITAIQTRFELMDCGSNRNNSISCYSEQNRSNMFLDFSNLTRSGCELFFSAISSESLENNTAVSLDVEVVQLEWWLHGNCQSCSKHAECIQIVTPVYGRDGYRCQCLSGFIGNGYRGSSGCRKEDGRKKKNTVVIVATTLSAASTLVAVISVLGIYRWCRIKREKQEKRILLHGTETSEKDETGDVHFFNLKTIQEATSNFSIENKLGEGGFGPVYKGKLINDGRVVAIKRLSVNSGQGLREFRTEVRLIVKLQHKNLVKLVGCCTQKGEKLLVYEFMPNNSLDTFLFDKAKSRELDWPTRANIISGIAKGLRYLHEDSRLRIVHRDMKASNVLLDNEMNAKISDFGTARIFTGNQTEADTKRIVGTYGYMALEYAMDGVFSTKSDVYSFGVLLLEIITGKKNSGFSQPEHLNLQSYAWRMWKEGTTEKLIDENIRELTCAVTSEAKKWTNIALLCIQENPTDRPAMSSVVFMLEGQSGSLPLPPKPQFSTVRFIMSDQSSSNGTRAVN